MSIRLLFIYLYKFTSEYFISMICQIIFISYRHQNVSRETFRSNLTDCPLSSLLIFVYCKHKTIYIVSRETIKAARHYEGRLIYGSQSFKSNNLSICKYQISVLAYFAFNCMNSFLGSTLSPISRVNTSSDACASSI